MRAQVDPLGRRRGARRERAVQPPRLAGEEEDRAVVVGVLGAVQHVGVRSRTRRRSRRARRSSRPSETLGTATSRVMPSSTKRPPSSTRVPPTSSVASSTRHVEVDRARRRCRRCPRSRRTRRGRCRASSRPRGSVPGQRRALVRADAELGEVAARRRRRRRAARSSARPTSPSALASRPSRDVERHRRVGEAEVASERVTIVPSPASGETNPSPHGRFPNAPGARRSPSSAIPSRPVRSARSRSRAGR